MKRMLINATHKEEELRIAIANGQYLDELIIGFRDENQSNIYKAIVTRVEPSLQAAFVDYGEERHGFLPLKEVARSCFRKDYQDTGRRPNISDVLQEGQELIVQVEKVERGNKGAALTTFITLPGCYLVLMPNNPRAGGVSRRIEGDERDELHNILGALQAPEGMGLIIRTAGGGRSHDELRWDLDILLRLWSVIQEAANDSGESGSSRRAPFLIYQEGNAVIRALRDYLRKDIDEILIDHQTVYEEVVNHLKLIRPDFVSRVKFYKDPTPLFTRFQIESQIESAFQREVRLPSGGSITIDHTEALVSIDINSAKSTKGGDIEETALMTNLESADEIARQLRLRDIGGLIVIDFIDMTPIRNQREVEDRLKRALNVDRARVQVGRISRFGLLEMSRQRLRPSLGDSSRITCPRCVGQGTIRGIESLGLSIIRIIEEEALKENTAQVRAVLPIEVAAYLLNEKRQTIIDIEKRQNVIIIVVPSAHLLTPQYEVERIRLSDITDKDEKLASYKLAVKPEVAATPVSPPPKSYQEPAIKQVSTEEVPPPPAIPSTASYAQSAAAKDKDEPGLIKKLFKLLFEKKPEAQAASQSTTAYPKRPPQQMRPNMNPRRKNGRHHNNRNRSRNRHSGSTGTSGGYRNFEQRDNRPPRDNRNRDNRDVNKDNREHRDGNKDNRDHREHRENYSAKSEAHHPAAINDAVHTHITHESAPAAPVTTSTHHAPQHNHNVPTSSPTTTQTSYPPSTSEQGQAEQLPAKVPGEEAKHSESQNTGNVQQHKKPRPRFHPHRHRRQHGQRQAKNQNQNTDTTKRTLEGEDIYTKPKDDEE